MSTATTTSNPTTTSGSLLPLVVPPLPISSLPIQTLPPVASVCSQDVTSHMEQNISSDGTSEDTNENLELSFNRISSVFTKILTDNVDQAKQDEFTKRLQTMYKSWREGKLNRDIRQRIEKLCDFMEASDFTSAEVIQVALAVDYTAECSSWIMVIKNIITQMKQKVDT